MAIVELPPFIVDRMPIGTDPDFAAVLACGRDTVHILAEWFRGYGEIVWHRLVDMIPPSSGVWIFEGWEDRGRRCGAHRRLTPAESLDFTQGRLPQPWGEKW